MCSASAQKTIASSLTIFHGTTANLAIQRDSNR